MKIIHGKDENPNMYWIRVMRLIDENINPTDYDNADFYEEHMICIDKEDINKYLLKYLIKHLDMNIKANYNRIYNNQPCLGFIPSLVYNLYQVSDIKDMIQDIKANEDLNLYQAFIDAIEIMLKDCINLNYPFICFEGP